MPAPTPKKSDAQYVLHDGEFDRDLADLAYIERILAQARRPDVPIGERLRFLAIVTSVLDEFLAVRLPKAARRTLPRICTGVEQLRERQLAALSATIDAMREAGYPLRMEPETRESDAPARAYFSTHVLPMLTPFAVDEEHPFPHLDHGECAFVITRATPRNSVGDSGYVIVTLPPAARSDKSGICDTGAEQVPVEILLREHAEVLIGEPVSNVSMIRIYRENDLNLAQDTGDLRAAVEDGLHLRPRNPVAAIEADLSTPAVVLAFVKEHLCSGRTPHDFKSALPGAGPLEAMTDALRSWATTAGAEGLYFAPRPAQQNPRWDGHADPFTAIRAGDILMHWPYERFDPLVRLLYTAATDPDVVAIRQTLYRTNETIVQPLIEAARRGAQVTVVFELEARENERHNIELSHQLQAAGARVVYGVIGLKVHAKLLLVTRREKGRLVNYSNVSTGNYHSGNAKHYSDFCLFTADPGIGRDLLAVFNYITGHLRAPVLEQLAMAPHGLREFVVARIEREAENARAGKPAAIWFKLNSLLDEQVCDALREAEEAGVEIHAVVRRHCALLPAADESSVRITSLMGRVLEHPRVVCFANGGSMEGGQAEILLSSADWMPRNFDLRVEVMVPVQDPTLRKFLVDDVMRANLDDRAQSWELCADGRYRPVATPGDGFCAQTYFAQLHAAAEYPETDGVEDAQSARTVNAFY